jgi:hypothetical protein
MVPDHSLRKSTSLRWLAIVLFASAPWSTAVLVLALGSPMPSELVLKDTIFRPRANSVDTVVVGDSRVQSLDMSVLAAQGWRPFNMGLAGLSAEDEAMALRYAMDQAPVRRILMGVTFESMTEEGPFQSSRYLREAPFARPGIVEFANPAVLKTDRWTNAATIVRRFAWPFAPASDVLHQTLNDWGVRKLPPYFSEDGTMPFVVLRASIASGSYDFQKYRDPMRWFSRSDGEATYLRTKRLSTDAQDVYLRVFNALRKRGVPTVVFETGRTKAYQRLIDENDVLRQLQSQWRTFFEDQSSGCVRFMSVQELGAAYRDDDFFDAAHYIGRTGTLVADRLADAVVNLESRCLAERR